MVAIVNIKSRLKLLLLVCCAGVVVGYFATRESHASRQYKHEHSEYCQGLASASEQRACIEQNASPEDYLPEWYHLIRWPEGITAWAVIATGFVIGWQSWETRKAAQATSAQAEISRKAFISQFRPRVRVRAIWLTEKEEKLIVEVWFANVGDSPAHVTHSNISIGWEARGGFRKVIAVAPFDAVTLMPGQDQSADVDISEVLVPYRAVEDAFRSGGYQGTWITCFGAVSYTDDNGASRGTAFMRRYDIKRRRFIPSDEPDEEYAD